MEETQRCPVCLGEVAASPRYPRYVCRDCRQRAVSGDGRRVAFYNDDVLGHGCVGHYVDTQAPYPSAECYIDGMRCTAEEAYFGGIVILAQA